MEINLGTIVFNGEKYFLNSLNDKNNPSKEEQDILKQIKDNDLFPNHVNSKFVLSHYSNNDFKNHQLEQIFKDTNNLETITSKSDKEFLIMAKEVSNMLKNKQLEYINAKQNGKNCLDLEKDITEISLLFKDMQNKLDDDFKDKYIDSKTEKQIKEIALYKEILEINDNNNFSNNDKAKIISNLITINSNLGIINEAKESLKFNLYSKKLEQAINDKNIVEIDKNYNNLLISMEKVYDELELNNDSFEKNPSYNVYKKNIQEFQVKDNYLALVDSVKNKDASLLADKYKINEVEIKDKNIIASAKDVIETFKNSKIEGISFGDR